ncbi:helix-turn-helix domain-containing protein [Pontibacter ummariensis]|nr:helix-turn-helix domain-containing protein [Pontibacter ummariensis]
MSRKLCSLTKNSKTMSVEIITKEDLQSFRRQLLEDLRQLLSKRPQQTQKLVLKSAEVRRLLQISPSTLQTLRINGTLPFTRIGGTIYYRSEDIERLMDGKEARP